MKVKCKSLAAEAKIIRFEEKRTNGALRDELHLHRVLVVRAEARSSHIAYALLRGRKYEQIERSCKTEPNWEAVKRMLSKYGPEGSVALAHR